MWGVGLRQIANVENECVVNGREIAHSINLKSVLKGIELTSPSEQGRKPKKMQKNKLSFVSHTSKNGTHLGTRLTRCAVANIKTHQIYQNQELKATPHHVES